VIYLDHHAATPVAPVAIAAMHAAEAVGWANPSSSHALGRSARRVLETARAQVAQSIGCLPADLVLTSGGTEACNLGILGILGDSRGGIVSTALEHPSVAGPLSYSVERGSRLTLLPTHGATLPDAAELRALLTADVALVAIQWVNHETGTLWPVAEYANVCREAGVPLFVDATQAWGKRPIDVTSLGATAVAIAAHKAGGPAGAAALWVARGTHLQPQLRGGGQERGRRAGSPDPVAQAGFGAVAEVIGERLAAQPRIGAQRDRLEAVGVTLGAVVNGGETPRVATVTNLSFRGRTGAALVAALDLEGVCCSSGAACSSGLNEPSPVLRALCAPELWRAESSVRFSFGPEVTDIDVENAAAALQRVIARPRA
jgi:cysteine desulfurase